MKIKTTTKTVTTKYHTATISAEDIKKAFGLPDDCELCVEVPSGGDYSGVELEIGYDTELTVKWEETETTSGNLGELFHEKLSDTEDR